jgi:eukaryotic-like serine/threonine-protein kinase
MAPTAPSVGEVLAEKYRLIRLLGSGGMGNVFEARHVALGSRVAVKVLHADLVATEDAPRRFAQEARAAAALKSLHAVRILDIDRTAEGVPFIVMEYLEGEDVGSLLADGPLPIARAIGFVLQACDAIGEAHARGIIHRDLKPRNLWLTPAEVVKVLDFGLAKRLPDDTKQPTANTNLQALVAAPHYLSPEQIRGTERVDVRTDIWSLGATLYQLVTGFPPFMGANTYVLCARILDSDPEPLVRRRPDAPPALEEVIGTCLAKAADDRYASIGELVAALGEVRTVLQRPRPRRPNTARPMPPRPPAPPEDTQDLPTEKRAAPPPPSPDPVPSSRDDTIKMTEAEAADVLDEMAVTTRKRGR